MIQDAIISRIQFPDTLYRWSINKQLTQRLLSETTRYEQDSLKDYANFLRSQPMVVHAQEANDQHYEVPAAFYDYVMGRHKKYSCGYHTDQTHTIDESEEAMLDITCERAQLKDGQRILELGCGWGSLTLFMAKKFPNSSITAVSNSSSQKHYIESQLKKYNYSHVTVITDNVATVSFDTQFDRIVTVEMLEHIRNYEIAFQKIASWLHDDGACFIHVFGHKTYGYIFDDADQTSWMARHFFTGGQMPSKDLFSHFNSHLNICDQWTVNGSHYAKTCRYWLENMDAHRSEIRPIFKDVYGSKHKMFWIYWRLFFMACEQLFDYNNGEEWQVYHYLLKKSVLT